MGRKNVNRLGRTKGVTAILLALTLAMGSFVVPVAPDSDNPAVTVVEAAAKKDKKKPVIKFSGKTNITVEKNEVVKIPKTTAKDNKDGNVTKKISVAVKKGKTNYKSIATKIKNNKKVKFSSTGKYTVTYTVKDKAGNKATKKRYVTVVDSKKTDTSDETTQTTTQQKTEPTTQATTEKVTTEATTEQQTTEDSKVEKPITGIYQETVNGITYNITRDFNDYNKKVYDAPRTSDKIAITIENDYETLYFDVDSGLTNNSEYLRYLGSIKAIDENGNDISDKIIIYEGAFLSPVLNNYSYYVYIYIEDSNGNSFRVPIEITACDFDRFNYDFFTDEAEFISSNPLVYGKRRSYKSNDND